MVLKIIGSILAAIGVLVAAFVALIYFGIGPNPFIGLFLDPPEHSARYYPRDTISYAWLTLYPEDGQFGQMIDLFERFNELPQMEERLEDLQDDVEDESGFKFEEELESWLGAEVSVGLLEERNRPIIVMTVSVRDFENAQIFMEEWTEHLEDEEGYDFDLEENNGIGIRTDEEEGLGFALTKEVLLIVLADDPDDTLEDMLDLITGNSERSLAEAEKFQSARGQYSDRRFASVFLDVEELLDLLEDSDLISDEVYDFDAISDSADLPSWVAVTVQWIDRGIVVEALVPYAANIAADLPNLENPAELVPAETIGFLATSFDPNLDNWRQQLEEYDSDDSSYLIYDVYEGLYGEVERQSNDPPRRKNNPDMADVLDLFLELVEAYTDVDLEKDIIEYLEGKLVLAVEEFDAGRIEEAPMEETVNVVAMLSYRPEAESKLEDGLEEFSDFLEEEMPLDIDSEDVGADKDAEIFKPDFFGIQTHYTPGYVLHDGYLIVGTTEEALQNVVAAQIGEAEDLGSQVEFRRVMEALPNEYQFLFWLDLQNIVAELEPEDLDMTEEDFEALEAVLGSVAIVSDADEELIRTNIAITLFSDQ
ncbi:MAG: DUF3352 domain-containing protein [Chloroflexi bacterium]|nr:DUF3352 domain-containing protein [Chloroflexota bacterium]